MYRCLWKNKKVAHSSFYLLITFLLAAASGSATSATYTITHSVIDSGGGQSSSASYTIQSSLGQSLSGSSNSVSYVLYAGFLPIPDTDGDSILDNTDNCPYISNPGQLDFDADLLGDACDADDDNDGLDDVIEADLGTDPFNSDTDGDGLGDFDEVNVDFDPNTYLAGVDTDPNNPDTDGDGLADGVDPYPLTPAATADGDLAPYGSPDGIINAADLMIAQRIALGLITPTAQDLIHGDLYPPGTPDGVINTSDLILLQKLVISQP